MKKEENHEIGHAKKFGGPFILRECTHMFQNQTEKFLNIFLDSKGGILLIHEE